MLQGTYDNDIKNIEKIYMLDVFNKLAAAEVQIQNGSVLDADTSLKGIREKYCV